MCTAGFIKHDTVYCESEASTVKGSAQSFRDNGKK